MKWYFVLNETADLSYVENAKVAVLSCLKNTRLEPNCVWDGSPNKFTDWLQRRGITVHFCSVSFLAELERENGKRGLRFASARGAYLRVMIPTLEVIDEYVLYTDSDVLFQIDPTDLLKSCKPELIGATTESSQSDFNFFNSGVMVMNITNLRTLHSGFIDYIEDNLPNWIGFSPNDQGALNNFFRSGWCRIDQTLNWKPYWGVNPDAYILHFHGARPHEIVRHLANPGREPNRLQLNSLEKQQSARHSVYEYASYLSMTDGVASVISDVELNGRLIVVTWTMGDENLLDRYRKVVLTIDKLSPIKLDLPNLPGPGSTGKVYHVAPAQLGELGPHVIGVEFEYLEISRVVIDIIVEHSSEAVLWRGHISSSGDMLLAGTMENRKRQFTFAAGTLRPFYVNLGACHPAAGHPNRVSERLEEITFPVLGLGPVYLDRLNQGKIYMPGGLIFDCDQTIDNLELRRFKRTVAARVLSGPKIRIQERDVYIDTAEFQINQQIEGADIFFLAGEANSFDNLLPLLIRCAMFHQDADHNDRPLVTDRLEEWISDLLTVLGIRNRIVEVGDESANFKDIRVISGNGSIRELASSIWCDWVERRLPAIQLNGDYKFQVLTTENIPLPAYIGRIEADLKCLGFHSMALAPDKIVEQLEIIRQGKLFLVHGSPGDAALAFAHPSSSVLEIMKGPTFQPSQAYRIAMSKRLGYAVLLTDPSLDEVEMPSDVLLSQIMDSSNKLLRSNFSSANLIIRPPAAYPDSLPHSP